MKFNNTIQHIRQKYDLTQNDLAKELNVARTTINNWENNNSIPNDEMKILISKKFNISLDEMFGVDSSKTAPQILKDINKLNEEQYKIIKSLINLFIKENNK